MTDADPVPLPPPPSPAGWDHAETVVGITTASPEAGYDAQDVFHINTVVDVDPPQSLRQVRPWCCCWAAPALRAPQG